MLTREEIGKLFPAAQRISIRLRCLLLAVLCVAGMFAGTVTAFAAELALPVGSYCTFESGIFTIGTAEYPYNVDALSAEHKAFLDRWFTDTSGEYRLLFLNGGCFIFVITSKLDASFFTTRTVNLSGTDELYFKFKLPSSSDRYEYLQFLADPTRFLNNTIFFGKSNFIEMNTGSVGASKRSNGLIYSSIPLNDNMQGVNFDAQRVQFYGGNVEPEPEPEPDVPVVRPIEPPVPGAGNEYTPYDTSLWGYFFTEVSKAIGWCVRWGTLIFLALMGVLVVRKIVDKFTSV